MQKRKLNWKKVSIALSIPYVIWVFALLIAFVHGFVIPEFTSQEKDIEIAEIMSKRAKTPEQKKDAEMRLKLAKNEITLEESIEFYNEHPEIVEALPY